MVIVGLDYIHLYVDTLWYTRFALRWDVPMSPCVLFFSYCPAQSFRTWSFVLLGYGLWISSRSNRTKAFSSQYLHPIVQTSAKVRGSFVGRCWHFHARCCSHLMVHDESITFSDFYQVCCFHVERSVLVTQCIEWHLPQAQTKRSQLAIAWWIFRVIIFMKSSRMPATICDQPSRIRPLTYEIREMWIRISSECPRSYVQNKHPQLGPFDHQAVGEVFSLGMPCSRRFETLISLISVWVEVCWLFVHSVACRPLQGGRMPWVQFTACIVARPLVIGEQDQDYTLTCGQE